jgi:hypothetical protein
VPGSHAVAEAPANGLYATIGSGGVVVKALDGNEIRLGERLTDTIEKAALYSTSNDNKQFPLSLLKTSAFSRDYGSIATRSVRLRRFEVTSLMRRKSGEMPSKAARADKAQVARG